MLYLSLFVVFTILIVKPLIFFDESGKIRANDNILLLLPFLIGLSVSIDVYYIYLYNFQNEI